MCQRCFFLLMPFPFPLPISLAKTCMQWCTLGCLCPTFNLEYMSLTYGLILPLFTLLHGIFHQGCCRGFYIMMVILFRFCWVHCGHYFSYVESICLWWVFIWWDCITSRGRIAELNQVEKQVLGSSLKIDERWST